MIKILIIGGMGIIGGAISRVAAKDNDVYILSRRELFGEWKEIGAKGIQGDWRNDRFAQKVVEEGFDVIVDTRVFNVKQLIRALRIVDNHCKQYIYISTDSVYFHPDEEVHEDKLIDIKRLEWDYGKNKFKAERYLLEHGDKYNFNWTVIRPTFTFGNTRIPIGYSSAKGTTAFLDRVLQGKPIIRFDNHSSRHAICHSSIFGEAVTSLFLNENAKGQFFHIADDIAYTYDDIYRIIEDELGVEMVLVDAPTDAMKKYSIEKYEELRYDKNPNFTLRNDKIKRVSPGINCRADIKEEIRNTIAFLLENRDKLKPDKEYDYITDGILITNIDSINDEKLKDKVKVYIEGLDDEYREKIRQYQNGDLIRRIKEMKRKTILCCINLIPNKLFTILLRLKSSAECMKKQ